MSFLSCSDSTDPSLSADDLAADAARQVGSIQVTLASSSIDSAATTQATAAVYDRYGQPLSRTVTWSSSDTAVATVSQSGLVLGTSPGTAVITASRYARSGSATVTVNRLGSQTVTPVASVVVALAASSIAIGQSTQGTATARDSAGNVLAGRTITWSSSDSTVAIVSNSGGITGLKSGSARIAGASEGKSGSAALAVTSAPPTTNPGRVSDLAVASVDSTSASLSFTQVDDGTGQPAKYDVRYAPSPISWGSATSTTSGSCTTPVAGTTVGARLNCTVARLTASTKYDFQVIAFRGTLNQNAGFGSLSNVVSATTKASGSPPPPPPPPPPPGNGTLLFQENFEDSNIASRGWYDNTHVELSTVEHIPGSTASSQYHFLAGANTPTSGGSQRHKFTPSNSVYISFYVKYSANWVGSGQPYQPHEFYLLSTLDGDWDGPSENFLDVYVEHNYLNGGRPRIEIQDNKSVNTSMGSVPNNLVGVTENRSIGGCNGVVESNIFSECFNAGTYWYNDKQLTGPVTFQPNPGPGYKNSWNFVEAYFQLNTIVNGVGQADGVVQYWFNGTLIIDRHDVTFRTGYRPTLQFTQLLIAPYIGDGAPANQYMWVDNLRVGTGRLP